MNDESVNSRCDALNFEERYALSLIVTNGFGQENSTLPAGPQCVWDEITCVAGSVVGVNLKWKVPVNLHIFLNSVLLNVIELLPNVSQLELGKNR